MQYTSVIAAASTGIASQILIGGGTAHRHFKVPNDVENNTVPTVGADSNLAKRFQNAKLIIIDVIFLHFFMI